MTEDEVRKGAFAMPFDNPAYPVGPYRFVDREYLIITYRTDPALLEKLIPAPLKLAQPVVKYEFINMPDSTGFGHYCESGQVIPVTLNGVPGSFVLSMYLNDHPPIAGGREIWGFPKKFGEPEEGISKRKIKNLMRAAEAYQAEFPGYKRIQIDSLSIRSDTCFFIEDSYL